MQSQDRALHYSASRGKNVFSAVSYNAAESATARRSSGSVFHAEGPSCENARSPNFARSRDGVKSVNWRGVAIRYVLPALWMTPRLPTFCQAEATQVGRKFKATHQEEIIGPGGRSLTSTIAVFSGAVYEVGDKPLRAAVESLGGWPVLDAEWRSRPRPTASIS